MPTPTDTHARNLEALAEVAVKVGLGIKAGQAVVMTAPIEGADLARLIAKHAYKAGASLVTTLYDDDQLALARYQNAKDHSFDHAAGWLYDGMGKAYAEGAARLAIRGGNPSLLAGQNPDRDLARQPRAEQGLSAGARKDHWLRHQLDAPAVCLAGLGDRRCFPTMSEKNAVKKLWDAIFQATRTDVEDPIANWKRTTRTSPSAQALLNEQELITRCISSARARI